jgi:restriction system protein
MPVPDFQTLMRPLLEEYAAGNERPIADVRAALAVQFGLTPEELAERLPRGCREAAEWTRENFR